MAELLHLFAADDRATNRIGELIAAQLHPGDLVLLDGDLGAGKTALARAIIRGCVGDASLEVPSPTFLLVLPYQAGQTPILHADLYRLAASADIEELGLFDDEQAIILVEWPDRAPELASRADLIVRLAMPAEGEGRNLTLTTPRHNERRTGFATTLARFTA